MDAQVVVVRALVVGRSQNPLKSSLNSKVLGCPECFTPKSCSHLDPDMDNVACAEGLGERVTQFTNGPGGGN